MHWKHNWYHPKESQRLKTPRGVADCPSCSSSGALQACSRSAVACHGRAAQPTSYGELGTVDGRSSVRKCIPTMQLAAGCADGILRLISGTGNLRCSDQVPSASGRYPVASLGPGTLFVERTFRQTVLVAANLTALGQCAQPEGDTGSLADSSVADTEYSQASTLLACLLLASQAGTLSSRCRRHPRRSVHIASESWPSRFWATPTHSSTVATSLPRG